MYKCHVRDLPEAQSLSSSDALKRLCGLLHKA